MRSAMKTLPICDSRPGPVAGDQLDDRAAVDAGSSLNVICVGVVNMRTWRGARARHRPRVAVLAARSTRHELLLDLANASRDRRSRAPVSSSTW